MGALKDLDLSRVNKEKTVAGSSPYNTIRPGMAYAGICKTPSCIGSGQLVLNNRGHGSHLVNDDLMMGAVRCPCCNAPFELEFIALFECTAVITHHRAQEEHQTLIAKGDDLIKLGCKANAFTAVENGLLTIESKSNDKCSIM